MVAVTVPKILLTRSRRFVPLEKMLERPVRGDRLIGPLGSERAVESCVNLAVGDITVTTEEGMWMPFSAGDVSTPVRLRSVGCWEESVGGLSSGGHAGAVCEGISRYRNVVTSLRSRPVSGAEERE